MGWGFTIPHSLGKAPHSRVDAPSGPIAMWQSEASQQAPATPHPQPQKPHQHPDCLSMETTQGWLLACAKSGPASGEAPQGQLHL